MKYFGALFVACLLFALVHSAPRVAPDSEEFSDESDRKNTDTILIIPGAGAFGSNGPFDPYPREVLDDRQDDYFNFGIFKSLTEMFQRRIQEFLRDQSEDSGLPFNVPKGSNSTSTTKVVNGHVVTVNDTTYSNGDDDNGSFFRFRVVEIKPQNDTLELGDNTDVETITSSPSATSTGSGKKAESTTPNRSVETVEDLEENVIPKGQVEII